MILSFAIQIFKKVVNLMMFSFGDSNILSCGHSNIWRGDELNDFQFWQRATPFESWHQGSRRSLGLMMMTMLMMIKIKIMMVKMMVFIILILVMIFMIMIKILMVMKKVPDILYMKNLYLLDISKRVFHHHLSYSNLILLPIIISIINFTWIY